MLSADYPCYMRREINRHKKTNVMYAVSAIGAADIGEVADDNFERTVLGGMLLGKKACKIENERLLSPEITAVSQFFVMTVDNFVLSLANSLGVFSTGIFTNNYYRWVLFQTTFETFAGIPSVFFRPLGFAK